MKRIYGILLNSIFTRNLPVFDSNLVICLFITGLVKSQFSEIQRRGQEKKRLSLNEVVSVVKQKVNYIRSH